MQEAGNHCSRSPITCGHPIKINQTPYYLLPLLLTANGQDAVPHPNTHRPSATPPGAPPCPFSRGARCPGQPRSTRPGPALYQLIVDLRGVLLALHISERPSQVSTQSGDEARRGLAWIGVVRRGVEGFHRSLIGH